MPEYMLKMLNAVANMHHQYGEPHPARNVRETHALRKLTELGMVTRIRYQGEDAYVLTDWGKLCMKPTFYMRGLPQNYLNDQFGQLGRHMFDM